MIELKRRIFSGVQPTGNLHIGNYLGAIKRFVELQESYECIYCIVDLHAITQDYDPDSLKAATREVAAGYLAAGINPQEHIVFNQSRVHEHSELAWIFNCIARMGWMNRMTQFKEKAGKNRENASVGLFSYPTLMAADILLYRATHVPVGDDQRQHLELCRDIAQRFNHEFQVNIQALGYTDGFFPSTQSLISDDAPRIMSLRDGSKKMSKSDLSQASRINLADSNDEIAAKVRKAKTDPHPLPQSVKELEERPEAKNLITIYATLAGEAPQTTLDRYSGQPFSSFKPALSDLAVSVLEPIRQKVTELRADPAVLDRILQEGAERAQDIASPILSEVKSIMGLA